MPDNLFETRQRINAAAQTRKITRTMELVASSRLQRAKQQLAAFAPALRHLSEAAACLPEAYFTPDPDRPKRRYLFFKHQLPHALAVHHIVCEISRITVLLEVGTLKIDQFGRVDPCYGMLIKMFYSRAPEQMA